MQRTTPTETKLIHRAENLKLILQFTASFADSLRSRVSRAPAKYIGAV
jgi:hypothetical protein